MMKAKELTTATFLTTMRITMSQKDRSKKLNTKNMPVKILRLAIGPLPLSLTRCARLKERVTMALSNKTTVETPSNPSTRIITKPAIM